jgi:hypothetical protein
MRHVDFFGIIYYAIRGTKDAYTRVHSLHGQGIRLYLTSF